MCEWISPIPEPIHVGRDEPLAALFDAATAKEREAFKGSWVAIAGAANGEALPEEFLNVLTITFDDEFHLKIADFFESRESFALDMNAAPRTITTSLVKSKATWSGRGGKVEQTAAELVHRYGIGSEFKGIYELDANRLKLCFAARFQPPKGDQPLPKRFDSHADGAEFGPLNLVLVRKDTGWVKLFNGKDLTGWKKGPEDGGDWKVENSLLVGRPISGPTRLFADRKDLANFQFRVVAKFSKTDSSGSGQLFRCEYSNGPKTKGYLANIGSNTSYKTGSLWTLPIGMTPTGIEMPVGPTEEIVPAETWWA